MRVLLFRAEQGVTCENCSVDRNSIAPWRDWLILIRRGRDRAWQFLRSLYAGRTNVIRVEEGDERRARSIVETYQDKDFSYCDAISFAVMERLGISEAISFDEHFRQYGKFITL